MNDEPESLGGHVARLALVVAALLVVVAAGWTWLTLSWAYSEGERAQYVVGGLAPQTWYFSVRDAVLAERPFKAVGQNVRRYALLRPELRHHPDCDTIALARQVPV